MFYADYVRERMRNVPKFAEAEGNPIKIDNAMKRPLKALNIFGETTQDGTPSVDNPIDVISVENPTLVVRGKNLFDINNIDYCASNPYSDTRFTVDGDVMTAAGEVSNALFCFRVPTTIGKTYTISCKKSTGAAYSDGRIQICNNNHPDYASYGWLYSGGSVTIIANTSYVYIKCYTNWSKPGGVVTIDSLMVEEGASRTGYERGIPIQSVTIPYTLSQVTDRRGKIRKDEIVVDYAKQKVTLIKNCYTKKINGDANWGVYSTASYRGFELNNVLPYTSLRETGYANQCKVGGYFDGHTSHLWVGVGSINLYWIYCPFYNSTLEDKGLADFKAHLNEHPLKFVAAIDTSYNTIPETDITDTECGQALLGLYTNREINNIITLNSESGLGDMFIKYVRK